MPFLIQYILKLIVSLSLVYLFYQLVLRRLTFYRWNRWYLVGYTMFCFLVSFIDISPVLKSNNIGNTGLAGIIPSMTVYTDEIERVAQCPVPIWSVSWDKWDWTLLAIVMGILFLLVRFLISYISFLRIRRRAELVSVNGIRLYQVDKPIIPFSFGNSIFINRRLYNESELKEIIRHEYVHVKQKHTYDIIFGELLCILNWYNPFAWLIRHAIRQNLEFIADHQVLENGLDKKQYQYMLLKVIGNNQFRIANQFNFSSLKKRIIMMNKIRSGRVQLLKFLFILPLLAVMLFAFRNEKKSYQETNNNFLYTDTIPDNLQTTKGYHIHRLTENGEKVVVVTDKNNKVVERVSLASWNADADRYEELYGSIMPPPPPPPPPTAPVPPTPPAAPAAPKMPKGVSKLHIRNSKATVTLDNGKEEIYNLENPDEKAAFEKKYGKQTLNTPPPPPGTGVNINNGANENNEVNGNNNINGVPSTPATPASPVHVGSGQSISAAPPVLVASGNNTMVALSPSIASGTTVNAAVHPAPTKYVTAPGTTVNPTPPIATGVTTYVSGVREPVKAAAGHTYAPGQGEFTYGETYLTITISKYANRDKLNKFIQEAKDKGVELEFDKIEYNSKNELTRLSGVMKKGNAKSTFSISDFESLNLMVTRNGDKYSCLVYMNEQKEEI